LVSRHYWWQQGFWSKIPVTAHECLERLINNLTGLQNQPLTALSLKGESRQWP
jgi:hypothetical protein